MHSEPSQTGNMELSSNLLLSGDVELNLGSMKFVHSTFKKFMTRATFQ